MDRSAIFKRLKTKNKKHLLLEKKRTRKHICVNFLLLILAAAFQSALPNLLSPEFSAEDIYLKQQTLSLVRLGVLLNLHRSARRLRIVRELIDRIALRRGSTAPFYLRYTPIRAVHDFFALGDREFFVHFRMDKDTFLALFRLCEPKFWRDPTTPGPKPAPAISRLLQTVRIIAQGTQSFITEAVVSRISGYTLSSAWIPETAQVIAQSIPVLRNTAASDLEAWDARRRGFAALQQQRSAKDLLSSKSWKRKYAKFWGGFEKFVEVFDGVVTPLQFLPRGYGTDAADLKHWRKGWAVNNMAGVEANGIFTSVSTGFPGRADDEKMLETMAVWHVNQGVGDSDSEDSYPPGMIALADSVLALRLWLLKPFPNSFIVKEIPAMRNALRAWNLKLSQIGVIFENSFGRLKGRWRILKFLSFSPDVSGDVVEASMALHNFLEMRGGNDVLSARIAEVEEEERLFNGMAEAAGQKKPESGFGEDAALSSTASTAKAKINELFKRIVARLRTDNFDFTVSGVGTVEDTAAPVTPQ